MMSKERMVQVTKEEYENLIRDQHTVELLTGCVQKQGWTTDSMLCLLLGIQEPKHELTPGWDPEPESETVTEDIPLPAMEEPVEEEKQSPPSAEPEKKSGRKKIDRGKVLALHRTGWSNKKIADEMACSEWSVSMILKELSEES